MTIDRRRESLLILAATAAFASSAACGTDLFERNGNTESGYFDVVPDGDLALGAWNRYVVMDYELLGQSEHEIGFELLSVSAPQVTAVRETTSTGALVVDGAAEGLSQLSFSARADGDPMDDRFQLGVRRVERVELRACESTAVYVRGTTGPVPYRFNPGASPAVFGLGLYPVAATPADAVDLDEAASDAEAWRFSISASAPSLVVLASTLPGDSEQLNMTIIDRTAIDGVLPPPSGAARGRTQQISLVPQSAGRPVCGTFRRVVRSLTPSVCLLSVEGSKVASVETEDELVMVSHLATGACLLALSLPDLGVELAWPSLTVTEPPSGGGGGGWDD